MWSGGSAARVPKGFARRLRNVVLRDGVWKARPQFTYDNVTGVRSFFLWEDDTNKVTRLGCVDSAGNLRVKGTSGETWGSPASGTVGGSRVTATATYKGVLYGVSSDTSGNPAAAFSYDGTTVSSSPFNSPIYARTLNFYKDRVFLAYPRVTVTPAQTAALSATYDWTTAHWTKTNCTASLLVSGGQTVCRIFPTSTAAECHIASIPSGADGIVSVASSPSDLKYNYLQGIRAVDAHYSVPITIEVSIAASMPGVGAVTQGALYSSGGYLYRVTTAGTTSGAAPAWTTTKGGTNTWGTATFTNEGSAIIAASEFEVPSRTENAEAIGYIVPVSVPWRANTVYLNAKIRFATIDDPLLSALTPLDVSLKDGLADGAAGKANFGLQFTAGEFEYPFFNAESASSATVDLDEVVWGEVGEPKRIRRQNYYNMRGTAGLPTAAIVAGGRYIVFKRRSITTFSAVEDANVVILPESDERASVGCIGPRAIDAFEDVVYFIGENEIYRMTPGGDPEPLCGDAMRAEVMSKSASTWVESQAAPANVAWLRIDPIKREMFVYTQKGKIYVYDLDERAWTTHDAGGDTSVAPSGYQTCDAGFDPTNGNVKVAFTTAAAGTAGVARLDESQAVAEDSISSSGTLPVRKEVWFPIIETSAPRFDAVCHLVRLYHAISATQSGQTLTAYVSRDHGTTFPNSNRITVSPLSTGEYLAMEIPLFQQGGTLLVRVLHDGKGGGTNFALSHAEADVQLLRGEYPKATPTQGTASL
jgi:hypothetical protein